MNGKHKKSELEHTKIKGMLKEIVMRNKEEKKNQEEFNSITQKTKPENQNQHHNVKKEGVDVKRRQM